MQSSRAVGNVGRNRRTEAISPSRGIVFCATILALAVGAGGARADIFGTLSNFDVYNQTPEPSEGFEIELEGCHSTDVYNTFPSHYNHMVISDYSSGAAFGTRITFTDYHFVDSSSTVHTSINPNPNPQSTNGHFCVNLPDCEHFGFAVNVQPTATRTYWLNQLPGNVYERINQNPLPVPMVSWSYQPPPVVGAPPIVAAVIQVPEPVEVQAQLPDSLWVKVYVTEMERIVDLDELMSGPGIVPQGETEIEWELLEGGVASELQAEVGENAEAVVRRYEFFEYTGAYSDEHEPLSAFIADPTLDPVALGEVGNFIAANMVAANLAEVPEASTWIMALAPAAAFVWSHRRKLSSASKRRG